MESITKCVCGSTNLRKYPGGDIRCGECHTLLIKKYYVDTVETLQINMSLDDIEAAIQSITYKAGCIIESLEHLGFYRGNGHHAAQDICRYAFDRFMECCDEKLKTDEKKDAPDIL